MKHYKVVHVQRQNYPVAYLSYDTKTQQFSLRIRKDVKLSSLPGMMRLFAQKGLYEPGEEGSKRWVQERIVPMDRHGIGIALRENGMTRYDECAILEKSQGKSTLDDLLVLPCEGPKKESKPLTPSEIKKLRMDANMTQAGLAEVLGMTVKAVEAWESGRNIPSGAADKILRVMQKHPSVIGMMQSV